MKNNLYRKGFIVSILLGIIAILMIGGGLYTYNTYNNKWRESPPLPFDKNEENNTNLPKEDFAKKIEDPVDINTNLKSFKLDTLEFSYPDSLTLKNMPDGVNLSHSLYKKHVNSCDLKDGLSINEANDFNVTYKVLNESMEDVIKFLGSESSYLSEKFIKDGKLIESKGFIDKYKTGSLDGYRITSGVEGCGSYSYYFPISSTKVLFIVRNYYLQTLQTGRQELEKISGFISASQEESIFEDILSSITGLENQKTMTVKLYFSNKIYNSEMLDCRLVYPVTRIIPYTQAVATESLNQLIKGPTLEEQKSGYGGSIPDGTKVNSIKIENNKAYVDFNENIGIGFTSCSGSTRLSSIISTLKQFPTIKDIKFSVEGNSNQDEIFQP